MYDVKTALRWNYDTMRLAAAREAVLSLGLLTPPTETRIYHFLDERLNDHPSARCTAWRKHGPLMSNGEKKAAGIRGNAFYSAEAYAELTKSGRKRPMDAHDTTLLRAQFTVFRYLAVIQTREAVEGYPGGAYRHETLHTKCDACSALDGRHCCANEIGLFPPGRVYVRDRELRCRAKDRLARSPRLIASAREWWLLAHPVAANSASSAPP